ncbi:MAG: hypothetical protein JWP31_1141 [Aeromicrobium sp.]|nr:hypothetical protein [Aeromicrobium sp.]
MASRRSFRQISAPAPSAWRLVTDPDALPSWFTSVESCIVDGDTRVCQLARGGEVRERIVTSDDDLRRFQYSIAEGIPVSSHLATIDVLDLDGSSCVVVYGTDVTPDAAGAHIDRAVEQALDDMKAVLERDTLPEEDRV